MSTLVYIASIYTHTRSNFFGLLPS